MKVDAHLVHFAALLRQNGIYVSTGEVMDAAKAVELVGCDDVAAFRAALSATMVKSGKSRDRFNRLFDLYFSGLAGLAAAMDAASAKAMADAGTMERAELERLAESFRRLAPAMTPLARAALDGDADRLFGMVRSAAVSLDFSRLGDSAQQGFLLRRLLDRLGMDGAGCDYDALKERLEQSGMEGEGLDLADRAFKAALKRIHDAAEEWVRQEAAMRSRHGEGDEASARPFGELSPEESRLMERSVRRLAERLKTRLSFKGRSFHRGRLDLRRTIRKSSGRMADGMGRLLFRHRRAEKPELVVLCDLSDSVRPTARMTMLFALAMQDMFSRTRTFVFVNEPREVTGRLKGLSPSRPMDVARLSDAISFGGNSDYGNVFRALSEGDARSFGRRTTLLVIGDGRSNFADPGLAAFQEIGRRVGRILWVTPEPEELWNQGDSELWRYRRHCAAVATVSRLPDLDGLADRLVPKGRR